ncbi:hypothetical protein CYMTET_8506 [Cymbomonas tetramitiformis]|uniref:Uncharacterized protein n=1 Tax=Cymbomonas tetramitiformis TaxID=36881 RepID=A0AAE0GTG4_9CHLO|nr:hypothetical protein CYMTET_8506 [Cymbomonas tetramitiformis]
MQAEEAEKEKASIPSSIQVTAQDVHSNQKRAPSEIIHEKVSGCSGGRGLASPDAVPKPSSLKAKDNILPIFLLCTCTLLWAVFTTFSTRNGANSGPNGSNCTGKATEGYFCICPRKTVCATEWHEVVFLMLSRCSAYFDYPLYILLFLTKCHNLRGALYRTHLREWLPVEDLHTIHTLAGTVVSVEVVWHSFWHLLRWGVGGDISFVWSHVTGRSGLVSLFLTSLIAWPMMFHKSRRDIPYGYRKAMHYLSVAWGISICFHAPKMHIGYIMGCAVGCYVLDFIYGYFMAIYFCPTLKMTRIGATAVEIAFEHPPGFVNRGGGYVYICLPWIALSEWHAFSLYKHPTREEHSSICIAVVGDWTRALHAALARPGTHSGWIYGPFPSPFSGATCHPNLIAVASGIGVTPTLGTISQLSTTHKVNVIWMTRDSDLIEYFVRTVSFDDDAWSIIFYTGKTPLLMPEDAFLRNPFLLLIEGRPSLRQDMLDIVAAIENDSLLPVEILQRASKMRSKTFNRSVAEHLQVLLQRATRTYGMSEFYQLALDFSQIEEGADMQCDSTNSEAQYRRKSLDRRPGGMNLYGFVHLILSLEEASGVKMNFDTEFLSAIFSQLDADNSGTLNIVEFEAAIQILKGVTQDVEKPIGQGLENFQKATNVVSQGARVVDLLKKRTIKSTKEEDEQVYLKDWGFMYCGGAAPVVKILKEMEVELGISLKIESFDW